ncbi:60S ribosomal protein L6 [Plasmodiophora brassicae]|uniref:60S ribosomal protein L6 n=1 Tax=Plasmodiophora brassicae TaxID=37360 RepID=A0A0G4IZF1_PLABS|nr:hypothetical protein PBRA_001777 [Plasmodiophora brassicae]SPQ93794.1 unnamed protein product [Plasmodiophora brassicae]
MAKPAVKTSSSRNRELARGVPALGRIASFKKAMRYKYTKGKHQKVEKALPVKSDKEPRMYPTERVIKPLPSRRSVQKPTKLRASITPGTVLILLAGRFKGKRVVFLKQLESGLLLITGPFQINGVPLRRVSQAYVLATSTKVDVEAAIKLAEPVTDAFFVKPEAPAKKESDEFFKADKAEKALPSERKTLQASIDQRVVEKMAPILRKYVRARFSLTKGQYPHQMKF